jgi:hypothetical protein
MDEIELIRDLAARDGDPVPADEARMRARLALTERLGQVAGSIRPRWRRRRLSLAAAIGFAAAVAFVAVGLPRAGSPTKPSPAFAAAAVKVAEANPRLLVTAPGWSIKHAYGFEVDSGSMVFGNGTHHLSLDWYPARLYRSYLHDRRKVSTVIHSTIVGHRATMVHYPSRASEPGADNETLFSPWGDVAVAVRGILASESEYQMILDSLRRVDVNTWLGAMPSEVVQPAALDATVKQMLLGVPLPLSFDQSTLPNPSLITDRYRLGTAVTGAVTCGWLEDWVAAARNHDVASAHQAARGLGTARRWPVLLAMAREKGWRGNQLPPNGNGWASEILKVAREIRRGRLSQGGGLYIATANGRYIEEGPGWSMHFGCRAHYRRQFKSAKTAHEIDPRPRTSPSPDRPAALASPDIELSVRADALPP